MNFTSPTFLFIFLPLAIIVTAIAPKKIKNLVLLIFSIVFIFLGKNGQSYYIIFFLFLIILNFLLGQWIGKIKDHQVKRVISLIIGAVINFGPLIAFKVMNKYNFPLENQFLFQLFPSQAPTSDWVFPIGLSYIAFQMYSYHFDVANDLVEPETNLLNFSTYILMFPKIVSGPIERYRNIAATLNERNQTLENITSGLQRFVIGLAKKILIADTIASFINPVFDLETPLIPTGSAWIVLVGFSIQLYFDFSGITDMALGIGKMLGFNLMENFNYPYISKSVSEFWRRWHISLSSWFRDYLFLPLEFMRRKKKYIPQALNVFIVFIATGLWHGLTRNYLIWGLILAISISIEMAGFGKVLKKSWRPLQHIWTISWIMFSWIFFRSPNPTFAWNFIKALVGAQGPVDSIPVSQTWPYPILDNSTIIALILGIVFSLPIVPWLKGKLNSAIITKPKLQGFAVVLGDILIVVLFVLSLSFIANRGFTPGIYDKF